MTDKMREEFEARFPVPVYVYWCAETEHYINYGNPLGCLTYRGQWEGWQASRESLVIELPAEKSMSHYHEAEAARLAFNDALEVCTAAIEAAGLKVAP